MAFKHPPTQVRDALSFFQAMDADRNGVVSREEFTPRLWGYNPV